MKLIKITLLSTLLCSALVLTGCALFAKNNANTNTVTQNENINKSVNVDTLNVNAVSNENTNTNSEIDTSNWKTYTNEEYGFSFRYPSDWFIAPGSNFDLTILTNFKMDDQNEKGYLSKNQTKIDIYFNKTDDVYFSVFDYKKDALDYDSTVISQDKVTINGNIFDHILSVSNINSTYNNVIGINHAIFSALISQGDNLESNLLLIDQIYSTIQIK